MTRWEYRERTVDLTMNLPDPKDADSARTWASTVLDTLGRAVEAKLNRQGLKGWEVLTWSWKAGRRPAGSRTQPVRLTYKARRPIEENDR